MTESVGPESTPLGVLGRATGSVFDVAWLEDAPTPRVTKRIAAHVRGEIAAEDALAREAGFLRRASHPAVPKLFATGVDREGPFLVEEAVLGRTLEQWASETLGDAPFPRASEVVRETARAVRALHALVDGTGPLALVLGDLSFGNIVLAREGSVRFVDFGDASHRDALSRAPMQGGTPPYAAPELLRGEALPTQATDVYALGAVALALLTGASLRPEREPAARLVRLGEHGIDLSILETASLARPLADVLARLVAFDPCHRETSLEPLLHALG